MTSLPPPKARIATAPASISWMTRETDPGSRSEKHRSAGLGPSDPHHDTVRRLTVSGVLSLREFPAWRKAVRDRLDRARTAPTTRLQHRRLGVVPGTELDTVADDTPRPHDHPAGVGDDSTSSIASGTTVSANASSASVASGVATSPVWSGTSAMSASSDRVWSSGRPRATRS